MHNNHLPQLVPSMKPNPNKSIDKISMDQFGLGIQVFKITSHKSIDGDKRKMMQHIENPTKNVVPIAQNNTNSKIRPPLPKRMMKDVLPSLDKQARSSGMSDIVNGRKSVDKRADTEKKMTNDMIKEVGIIRQAPQRKVVIRKPLPASSAIKQPVASPQPQKTITQRYYKPVMSELPTFYTQSEQIKAERGKEIRRLKRLKQNQMTEEMKARLIELEFGGIGQQITGKEQIQRYGYNQRQQFDQWNIDFYRQGGVWTSQQITTNQNEKENEEDE